MEFQSTDTVTVEEGRLETKQFWVFGYGSLCWNPGFEYEKCMTGYIKGFSRRFWQGNTTHRGTENKPGRVATLIEDKDGITWGKAFLVSPENKAALPYLSMRECKLGGYRTFMTQFYHINNSSKRKQAYLYVATPDNHLWLGEAPMSDIARQILESRGKSGSNVEYLLKLAEFMRVEIPGVLDDHLFTLERLVRIFASEMKICLKTLMGDEATTSSVETVDTVKTENKNSFVSRVPEKKLRCVNI